MNQWSEALADRLPVSLYSAYVDDSKLPGASDKERCAVTVAFYAAVAAQPEEAATRVYARINTDEPDPAPTVARAQVLAVPFATRDPA